jgi:predicted nucleic acid-binding protein
MEVVHLDAGVVIGFLDREDAHHRAADAALNRALQSGQRLAMAASAFAECLVGPYRRGAASAQVVRGLFDRVPITIVGIDDTIADAAARLRAAHSALRLPDALVIATAVAGHAGELITTDGRWPTPQVMKVRIRVTRL